MSGLIGVSAIHIPVDGEAKERVHDAEAGALRARTERQSSVEQVGIGWRELVDQHVAEPPATEPKVRELAERVGFEPTRPL